MRRSLLLLITLGLLVLLPATAAEATGGTVLGWGQNELGETGIGSNSSNSCHCVMLPTPVVGLTEATAVSGGNYHSLALRANGTVMAWGSNETGQLGNGTTEFSPAPVAVAGLSNVVAVSAGGENSLALLADGRVMAWGDNFHGESGLGTTTGPESCGGSPCAKLPHPVPGITNAVQISAGDYTNMVLLADGTVLVWGYDRYGELGNGAGMETGCECISTPTPLAGVSRAMAISNGWYHGGALLADGTLRAWGYDYEGQLGNGTPVRTSPPSCFCLGVVPVAGVSGARSIDMGGYHGATLLQDGSTRIWGENYSGQLGIGSNTRTGCNCSATPLVAPGQGLLAINPAGYHTLALQANGTALAWGENLDGQLGDGTLNERVSPVAVSGVAGASAVAGRSSTSFALIGPSQQLSVAFAGAGSGIVGGAFTADSSQGILCPGACSGRFPQGQVEILRAEPSAGTGFAGFSGPCTGTGPCHVTMSSDQTVTATFGPAAGTKILKAKINHRKRSARFTFTTPGAITGYQCKLLRPVPKHHRKAKSSALRKASFKPCSSPRTYRHLKVPGSYRFLVRGVDSLGPDAKPATRRFKLKAKRHRH